MDEVINVLPSTDNIGKLASSSQGNSVRNSPGII